MTASEDFERVRAGLAAEVSSTRFSRLRLSGGRYDDAGFPLEGLDELIIYERLVLEVARSLWRQEHPQAKRVPNNFEDALALKLTQIRPGSTIPLLERASQSAYLPGVDALSLIDQAQDLVDRAFNEIVERNALPTEFPRRLRALISRVGSTLRYDEGIQFGPQESAGRGRYTQAVRHEYLRGINSPYKVGGSLAGRITALDTEELRLTVQTLSGRSVTGTYAEHEQTENLLQVFNAAAKAPIVRLDGVLEFDTLAGLKSISSIDRILVLDLGGSKYAPRFEQLLGLEPGWNGPGSQVPDFVAIERAVSVLALLESTSLPDPGIFALPDGGIQLEWMTQDEVWGIDILLDAAEIEVSIVDVSSQDSREMDTANPQEAVQFLANHVRTGQ